MRAGCLRAVPHPGDHRPTTTVGTETHDQRSPAAASLPGAAGLAAATALPRAATRQWRPTEAVRIIIPAAPGGTTDLMGRLLGQHLQVAWGQSTVVENKSGGGGTIAMSDFVRQKPDGHTIMIGNPGPNAVAY